MATINVKRGIEFKARLLQEPGGREDWLLEVGKQLERRGLSVTVGEAHERRVVKNGKELVAAFQLLDRAAKAQGSDVKAYMADLLQALDDLVKLDVRSGKPVARTEPGDALDLSRGSEVSRALGLHDGNFSNYASMVLTDFGKAAVEKPEATMTVDGVTLQRRAPTPTVDLAQVPHIHAESFKALPPIWARDGEEVEDTRVVTGLSKAQTVQLAAAALGDLQRPRGAVGLTLREGRSIDQLAWDEEAHELRRASPYVSFTLDERSLELNPNSGEERVGIGRDFFYDVFMARKDPYTGQLTKGLQKADAMLRGRIRYGSDSDPFRGTRVLVGMKAGTAVDADGTKHAWKIDSRTDSPNQAVFDSLVESTQTGRLGAGWSYGAQEALAPATAAVYRIAVQKGLTDDVGGKEDVLLLAPGAVARQIRGRFHLNETPAKAITDAFRSVAESRLPQCRALIAGAEPWPAAPGVPSRDELLAKLDALVDRSAIVAAATPALKAAAPQLVVDKALVDSLWPTAPTLSSAQATSKRAVADAIRACYDDFAAGLTAARRHLAGNLDAAVRAVGNPDDVMDFLRQKAAVERVRRFAGGSSGDPAAAFKFVEEARSIPREVPRTKLVNGQEVELSDAEKDQLRQRIRARNGNLQQAGVGLEQLRAMSLESFASPARVDGELGRVKAPAPFLAELDRLLASSSRDAFVAELAAYLESRGSPALAQARAAAASSASAPSQAPQQAGDDAVARSLDALRRNLTAEDLAVRARMVEAAGAWAQAAWFNDYRRGLLGINPQSWNFLIASMDYTEFYTPEAGLALSFKQRVSREPLDPGAMTGAMLSNDLQIELDSEEAYTSAIKEAQYQVNGALAGLVVAFARQRDGTGMQGRPAAAVEDYLMEIQAQRRAQRVGWLEELAEFAKARGFPGDVKATLPSLVQQVQAARLLEAYARKVEPTLAQADRPALQAWYRQQMSAGDAQRGELLTKLSRFANEARSDVTLSEDLLRRLVFTPFSEENAALTPDTQRDRVERLRVAHEVWGMVKQSQRDLSAARGREVLRVLRRNGLPDAGWEPPTKPKGDYGIDYALP